MWDSWGGGPTIKKKKPKRVAKRTQLPFKRVQAEIKIEETGEVVEGRVFLTDLSETGVGLFSPAPIAPGEKVILTIEEPRQLYVKGKIVWCAPYTLNMKILSSDAFTYRVGIKFQFDKVDDVYSIRDYCNSLYDTNL